MTAELDLQEYKLKVHELEYNSLRAEILQRMQMRQQIIYIMLTIAGAFLAFGITNQTVVLIYPLISTGLAVAWSHHHFHIRDTARYIRENIERNVYGMDYETSLQRRREDSRIKTWRSAKWSYLIVCLVTQFVAIFIGCMQFSLSDTALGLIGIDGICMIAVIWVVLRSDKLPA